jgi:hypothetical protein
MANKKVSQLVSKPSVLVTDLFPIADPTTGQLFKTTISDLGTAIGSGVSSVNTLVGAVVLDTDDIQELASPTNRWFTDTRARAALSASSPLAYNSGTGVFSIPAATSSQDGYLTSADWTTFNAKQAALSGTGFVKISGTTISYDNSTYLTTSAAASTYLALAGGTLTGALNGTSATFTGDLTLSATNPRLYFTDTDNNPDYFISNTDGTFTIYDVTASTSRLTINGTTATLGANLTATSFIRSGGTSTQFLKADGSVDSSTYLTGSSTSGFVTFWNGSNSVTGFTGFTYNTTTQTLAVQNISLSGNILLPANNTAGGTNYYIGQTTATSDIWKIYGNTVGSDQAEMIFDIGDNGSPFASGGQRFRFFYSAGADGTPKSPLTIDYDTSTFTTALVGTSATFSGALSGTTATFSGDITIGTIGNSSSAYHRGSFNGTNTSANLSAVYFSGGDGSQNRAGLKVYQTWGGTFTDTNVDIFVTKGGVGGTTALSINGLGAATFSSSVSSTSLLLNGSIANSADSSLLTIKQTSQTANNGIYIERSGERNGYFMYVGGGLDSLNFRRNYFGTQSDTMSLTREGDVLISATAPVSTRRELRIGGNASGSRISMGIAGTNYSALVTDSGGNVYLANEFNDSSIRLLMINFNNGVYLSQSATSWTSNSDERMKTDLVAIENATEKVASLRSVIGRYKTDDESKRRPFLIAQDVHSVLPEAVDIDQKTGMMGIQYTEVIPLLVASIKELKAELDTLKNK